MGGIEPIGDRLRVVLDAVPPITAEVTRGGAGQMGLAVGADVAISVKATELEVYPA
ncbi:MAG: TOBE domain-containing protein [Actinomycetota bacterium]|nr:TOBE domain-containing protein [Actinomycetota bacterium]